MKQTRRIKRKSKRRLIKGGNLRELQPHLIDGVNARSLNTIYLCRNPAPVAVDYIINQIRTGRIEANINLSFNTNPDMVHFLLTEHFDNIDWNAFSANSCDLAVDYLLRNQQHIKPEFYSNSNERATRYCLHREKTDWKQLCLNSNDLAVDMILRYVNDTGIPTTLYENSNPTIVEYALANTKKKDFWLYLAKNPNAVAYIFENINKIYTKPSDSIYRKQFLENLCENTNVDMMEYIVKNYGKSSFVDWRNLSANPSIFQNTDYILK